MSKLPLIFPPSDSDSADLAKWFPVVEPEMTSLQRVARATILAQGYTLATIIQRNLPKCADRGAAIRQLRDCVSTALAGIAAERGAYVEKEKK